VVADISSVNRFWMGLHHFSWFYFPHLRRFSHFKCGWSVAASTHYGGGSFGWMPLLYHRHKIWTIVGANTSPRIECFIPEEKRPPQSLSLGNYFRIFKIEFAYFLFGRIYITLQKATATSLCDVPVIKCWSLVYICVCVCVWEAGMRENVQ